MTAVAAAVVESAGRRMGRAIAREVLADKDMPRKWSDDHVNGDDADTLTAAGIQPDSAEWKAAFRFAREEYEAVLAAKEAGR